MNKKILVPGISILLFIIMISYQSCTHDPVITDMDDDMMPDTITMDTIEIMDTTAIGNGQNPCNPDTVYFQKDILPLLKANCAISGCHNSESAQNDVVLESYGSLINSKVIKPYDLDESDIYEVLTENDEDKRMPPPPASRLQEGQVALIAKWIQQGAQNLICENDSSGNCNIGSVSYTGTVKPVIDTYCISCHSGPAASGGVNMGNYNNLKTVVDNGKFYGAISWSEGYANMPQGSNQLDQCILESIKKWIDEGAQNN